MNYTNLRADARYLCGATSGTYADADVMRNMNIAYQRAATLIWEADPTYAFDDRNNTDGPVAYRTVANASASYMIPTTALRIRQVEIKDGSGDWQKLTPINYAELSISPEEYFTGTGTPTNYAIEGNEIRLFPAPGTGYVTMASGMAVRLQRAPTDAAVTATTTEPGFATAYHRYLSYSAAVDFTQDPKQREFLLIQKDRLERGLVRFYGRWAGEYKSRIKPNSKKNPRRYS